MPSEEEMVTFRLAPRDRAAIQRLIDAGEFRNRSDFLRYAVKATLAAHGETAAPLDLSLEGVELPAPPTASRARNTRARTGQSQRG